MHRLYPRPFYARIVIFQRIRTATSYNDVIKMADIGQSAQANGHSTNGHATNGMNGHSGSSSSSVTSSSRDKVLRNGHSTESNMVESHNGKQNGNHSNNNNNNNNRPNGTGRRVSNGAHPPTESKPKQANGYDSEQVYFDVKQPLPKLPVPDLHKTLEKYLTLLKTVVSPGEYSKTKRVVEEFSKPGGDGHKLQDYLLGRQQERDNWANEYWLYDMYLNIRLPLILNSNPAAVFRRMTFFNSEDQIKFAARFVLGLMDFKRLVDTGNYPVELCSQRENGRPMCMDQHTRLLSSSRRPGKVKDTQHTNVKDVGNEFIVVACRNQFFRINVQHDGSCIQESSLVSQMTHTVALAQMTSYQQPRVGLLTSQSRDVWAEQRERLAEDPTNSAILSDIEEAVCLLCLDHCGLGKDMTSRTHHILHGGGSSKNSGNRWMDKSVQVIVSEDGTCGVNMEHSIAEGIALGHMLEHVFSFMAKEPTEGAENVCPRDSTPTLPTPYVWNLSSDTLTDIQQAADFVDGLVEDLDLTAVHFKDFGREFIKGQRMSPDAFVQLALQLTYFKIHHGLTSTYESASVRRFRDGRVDVIRSNSPAALAWIKAMLGLVEATEEAKLQLMKEAIEWQQENTKDTIMGHGVDLHLGALRGAATDLCMPVPAFFTDPSYDVFNYFNLSTSQVMTKSDYWMGYGAVVPEGYGCCYNPKGNSLIFCVASFNSCYDTSSDMFVATLESSLNQMAELSKFVPVEH